MHLASFELPSVFPTIPTLEMSFKMPFPLQPVPIINTTIHHSKFPLALLQFSIIISLVD